MTDYDMNTGIPHEPRPLIEVGFAVDDHGIGPANTAYRSLGTNKDIPLEQPSPVQNETIKTSNTVEIPIGPSAHDLVMRSRNG